MDRGRVRSSNAVRPTLALLRAAGRPRAAADIAEAQHAGIVAAGGVVRFTHPLLSAVLYTESCEQDRLAAHAALADTVTDPVERARHLALITPGRDASVAETLREAATAARGDTGTAIGRMEQAVAEFAALPYRLEEGRARLELGRLHLRSADAAAARESLHAARRLFEIYRHFSYGPRSLAPEKPCPMLVADLRSSAACPST